MAMRIPIVVSLAVSWASTAGVTAALAGEATKITLKDAGRKGPVVVQDGGKVELRLEEQASVGAWSYDRAENPDLLELKGPPSAERSPLPGYPGIVQHRLFSFTAKKKGKGELKLVYKTPSGLAGRTFTVPIEVR